MMTEKYVAFFKYLEENNNKEWFRNHKKDYEEDVKQPFLGLLAELLPGVKELESTISSNPKDALFRIHRDIRFTKDKSPYHTLMKAEFSPGGRKSEWPGFYLGIGADKIHVGGGLFTVYLPRLKKIHYLIKEETERFVEITTDSLFKSTFSALKGERVKRLDPVFQDTLTTTPYIANKQFYAMKEIPLDHYIRSDELPQILMKYFKAVSPLNNYLKRAYE